MEILSRSVHEILQQKGVETIYHANSVITACQFLRSGSLLSRGTIYRRRMYQTPQTSDRVDKSYGVWFDIFADSVDIHSRANRANLYGPVLLVFDTEIIRKTYTGKVWVTKRNPTKWSGRSHEQRWFTSGEDLKENFVKGRFDQMIVFRHSGGELPFAGHLKEVVLDDPSLKLPGSGIDYYSMAYGALRLALTEGGLDVEICKRICVDGCACRDSYRNDPGRTKQMFVPTV